MKKIRNDSEFVAYLKDPEIFYLVHFTQADNLKSIFNYGVLSHQYLMKNNINARLNDLYRLDNMKDATSISILFPNYKMFYSLRLKDESIHWAVIVLKIEILFEKKCIFCADNAANSKISSISKKNRMGIEGLKKLYVETPGMPTREVMQIPKTYPTNPQAEILVNETIEPKYILGVVFEDEKVLQKHKNDVPLDIHTVVHQEFFRWRSDFQYWKS